MASERLVIRGGKPLTGDVFVPGAKNAALKMIAAALLTDQPCVLENVPQITDVKRMLAIVEALGAEVLDEPEAHRVTVTARSVDVSHLPEDEIRSFRASIVLLGPLLVRCAEVRMPYPGGDLIGARPISAHVKAFEQLGAAVEADGSWITVKVPHDGLRAGRVVLPEFSVTATENALLVAAATPGRTIIEIAAVEPHVQDLARMLSAMGAKVSLAGQHVYVVEGSPVLRGVQHRIVPDVLDAFTFLVAGILTRGDLSVAHLDTAQLRLPLEKLRAMGANVIVRDGAILTPSEQPTLRPVRLQTLPYPGVPTDLQPLFALLATQAEGTSMIYDTLYENRFRYLEELVRMGADAKMLDPHRAVIHGPTSLVGVPITSYDLRAGAVLVVAGLVAEGETVIDAIEHIDRGYEYFDERLRALGAEISRVTA